MKNPANRKPSTMSIEHTSQAFKLVINFSYRICLVPSIMLKALKNVVNFRIEYTSWIIFFTKIFASYYIPEQKATSNDTEVPLLKIEEISPHGPWYLSSSTHNIDVLNHNIIWILDFISLQHKHFFL